MIKFCTKILALVMATVYLAGCAPVPVYPQSIGGSRSDGIINMSYEYSAYSTPDIQWGDANADARARCKGWGYRDAVAFGGATKACIDADEYGCNRYQGFITYQCTK